MNQQALFPITDGNYHLEREPMIRIGIVLKEDRKEEIRFQLPPGDFRVSGEGESLVVKGPLENLRIKAREGSLEFLDATGKLPVGRSKNIRVEPQNISEKKKPGDGIRVKELVSGRGFHWNKTKDQTLTGALEFLAVDGRVVMINELPLEDYLLGVVTGEMSGDCPREFVKAQAVAARSWLLAQPRSPHPLERFHWCNDDCCQRYQGTGGWTPGAIAALEQCRGEVLITASNHYCDARYSKSTGGISEDSYSVWGEALEGLDSVLDAPAGSPTERFVPLTEENLEEYLTGPGLKTSDLFCGPKAVPQEAIAKYLGRVDEMGEYFRWRKTLTRESLCESLVKRAGIKDLVEVTDCKGLQRGKSGRLESIEIGYIDDQGQPRKRIIEREQKIRAALSMSFLYSSAFIINCRRNSHGKLLKIELQGAGWGHGAGMCQIGALGRALQGQLYREIILHYFSGVHLERIYP